MGDDDGATAVALLHALAHPLEDLGERLLLVHGAAQGVEGIDAGELQRRLLQVGPLKGLDMKMEDLIGH